MKLFKKIIIIGIEILALIISGFLGYDSCGNACNTKSLIDPFGIFSRVVNDSCMEVCVPTFSSLTYFLFDLFILTVIIYVIKFITYKIKKRYKEVKNG